MIFSRFVYLCVLCFYFGLLGPALMAQTASSLSEINLGNSELSDAIRLFTQEERNLNDHFEFDFLPAHRQAKRLLWQSWQARLVQTDFTSLAPAARVDYLLFEGYLKQKLAQLSADEKRFTEACLRLPFLGPIANLAESRRQMKWTKPNEAAGILTKLSRFVREIPLHADFAPEDLRFFQQAERALDDWYNFYHTYDPQFDWWVQEPYNALKKALQEVQEARQRQAGTEQKLDGVRIGEQALRDQLAAEMIPYSPQELIAIGQKELDWCIGEMRKVSKELGYGDNWHMALEQVKQRFVPPGEQPEAIRKMAFAAIDFLEKNDLLTIPRLAKEDWHIDMLSPRQQLMNPFFTGGDVISVAYPTATMTHEQKMMSMRGNNPHFCWATVHHELIPGHHLQGYMSQRYHAYRSLFDSPFYLEGWPLYWEMKLWDMNFIRSPEDRVGMLFWRMHRCARIVFSLSYHLGLMSAEQCVDLLVKTVGHEPDNARAEVRRSFAGWYSPLYQCAYLLGGLQLRALADEATRDGKMTLKSFHDAVLRENSMPIALLRAKLLGLPIEKPFKADWRFYEAGK